MGIFRQFPYTNFHEMNMDEIIKIVLKLSQEWLEYHNSWEEWKNQIDNDFSDLKEYVMNFFDNLDVQEEVNNYFDHLIDTGEFLALLQDYLPFVTPQMYGAQADGTADDTQAIQNAFNSGQMVFIPEGTYKCTQPITIPTGLTVRGTEASIILDYRDYIAVYSEYSGLFHASNIANVSFETLTIDSERTEFNNQFAFECTFYFNHARNIRFTNVKINKAATGYAILFNMQCENMLIDNCEFDTFGYCAVANLNEGNHLTINKSRFLNQSNKAISGGQGYSLFLNGYDETPVVDTYGGTDLNVTGCYFYDENPTWEQIDAHGGQNITVIGNILDNAFNGINIFNDYARHFKVKNVVVSDNIVTNVTNTAQTIGIELGGEAITCSNNIVDGAYQGFYIRYLIDTAIINNIIKNCAFRAITIGPSDRLVVKNNMIYNIPGEFAVMINNYSHSDMRIENNIFRNCTAGIRTPNTYISGLKIKLNDNEFHNVPTPNSVPAIDGVKPQFMSSTPTITVGMDKFDIILNNNLDNETLYGWIFDGTGWCRLPLVRA